MITLIILIIIFTMIIVIIIITWAERQEKDSRRSGMSQSCFWMSRKERGISSRYLEITASSLIFFFILLEEKIIVIFGAPGVWTGSAATRQIRV